MSMLNLRENVRLRSRPYDLRTSATSPSRPQGDYISAYSSENELSEEYDEGDEVSKPYNEILAAKTVSYATCGAFTRAADMLILRMRDEAQLSFDEISQRYFPRRPAGAVERRYHKLTTTTHAETSRQTRQSGAAPSAAPVLSGVSMTEQSDELDTEMATPPLTSQRTLSEETEMGSIETPAVVTPQASETDEASGAALLVALRTSSNEHEGGQDGQLSQVPVKWPAPPRVPRLRPLFLPRTSQDEPREPRRYGISSSASSPSILTRPWPDE